MFDRLAVIVVLARLSLCSTTDTNSTVVDPFKDPKDDTHNPLRYIPSNALSAVALGKLYLCPVAVHLDFR
jgi:hypothetical protein